MNTKSFDLPRHSPNVSLITAAHHDLKGTGRYFATMVTERRQPVLSFICQGGYARWTDVGQHVNNEIQALTRHWPIAIDRLAIMPDHIHLCFRVTESMDESVLRILSNCRNFAQKESGFTSDKNRLWERKYRLFVAFNREAYGRCIDYTAANPLRWWLTHHQSKILTPQMVKHEFLPREFQWQALGHLTLLDSPLFFPIVIHRNDSPEQIENLERQALRVAQNGGVIVGGFISQAEKALLKALYAKVPMLKLIRLVPHTLNDYKPPAHVVDAFAQGRRLLLTSEPNISEGETCRRDVCVRHNAVAELLAATSRGLCLPG